MVLRKASRHLWPLRRAGESWVEGIEGEVSPVWVVVWVVGSYPGTNPSPSCHSVLEQDVALGGVGPGEIVPTENIGDDLKWKH